MQRDHHSNESQPLLAPSNTKPATRQLDTEVVAATEDAIKCRVEQLLHHWQHISSIHKSHHHEASIAPATAAQYQQVVNERKLQDEALTKLWGGHEAPPYTPCAEDATSLWSRFTYSWIGPYIHIAASEKLSIPELPPPTKLLRTWEVGRRMSLEMQREVSQRHGWDAYIGYPVLLRKSHRPTKRHVHQKIQQIVTSDWFRRRTSSISSGVLGEGEDASVVAGIGFLRWVGILQCRSSPSKSTTGALYAGVEWLIPPCLWRDDASRSKFSVGVSLEGTVDGEHLFNPVTTPFQESDDVMQEGCTCEPIELLQLLMPSASLSPQLPTGALSTASFVTNDVPPGMKSSATMFAAKSVNADHRDDPAGAAALDLKTAAFEPPETPRPVSLLRALWRVHKSLLLVQLPFKFLSDYVNLTTPILLEIFVDFLSSNDLSTPEAWKVGMSILIGIVAINVCQTFATQKFYDMSIQSGLVLRGSIVSLVFEKSLMISGKVLAHPDFGTGRLVNMISTDAERVNDFTWYWLYLLSAPQQLIIAIALLYRLVGWCAFAGIGMIVFVMPAQGWVTRRQQVLRQALSKITDKRVKYTTELFSGIRTVKFMGWELNFLENIQNLRSQELELLRRIQTFRVLQSLVNVAAPSLVVGAVLITFHASGHELTPAIVFPTISLLGIMRIPFAVIPFALTSLIQLLVAVQRITKVLESDNAQLSNIHDIEAWYHSSNTKQGDSDAPCIVPYACVMEHATVGAFMPVPLPPNGLNPARPDGPLPLPGTGSGFLQTMLHRVQSKCSCLTCRNKRRNEQQEQQLPKSQQPKSTPQPSMSHMGLPQKTENTFYELSTKSLLRDVTLRFPRGQLSVIVGPTGSGKSTLLDALLGMLQIESGDVFAPRHRNQLAYVPQQPWIMNATVRENIVFFDDEDPEWLQQTIRVCDLQEDLQHLVCGIDTEIGEKGVTLSGGQRARVSLARAIYAKRDVLLLDDPLSALDAHVSEKIVSQCLLGLLSGTTRLLCTHHLHVLPLAAYIVVLDHDPRGGGCVKFAGDYATYAAAFPDGHHRTSRCEVDGSPNGEDGQRGDAGMARQTTTCSMYEESTVGSLKTPLALAGGNADSVKPSVETTRNDKDDDDEGDEEDVEDIMLDDGGAGDKTSHIDVSPTAGAMRATQAVVTSGGKPGGAEPTATTAAGKLMSIEEKAIGSVPWKTYLRYADRCGGVSVLLCIIALFTVTEAMNVSNSVWLSFWSSKTFHLPQSTYLYGFIGCIAAAVVVGPIRFYVAYNSMRRGSLAIHQQVLFSVASAPMSFFDTTPLGRILNRFSRDVDMVDNDLQMSLISFLQTLYSALSSMAVMVVSQPLTLVAILPCSIVYYKMLIYFNKANREIRRISTTLKSPMYALLTESLNGYRSIRAYDKGSNVMESAVQKLDVIYAAGYMQNVANRWLGLRIEAMAAVIITTVAAASIFEKIASVASSTPSISSNVGLLALGFTLATSITQTLNWIVRASAAVEADMNSVERLFYYIDSIPHEPLDDLLRQMHVTKITRRSSTQVAACCVVTRSVGLQCPEGSTVSHGQLLGRGLGSNVMGATPDATNDTAAIVFRDVGMRYRPELPPVLHNLTFTIQRSDKVGVVGRTGSGKSSLLLTFLRIMDVYEGTIEVLGRPIPMYDLHELRSCFSMIPQDPLLFDGTVRSNLDPFHAATDVEIMAALEMVGMRTRVEQDRLGLDGPVLEHGQNYSVGQRQLLCLARALLRKHSPIILMDEATANIDPQMDRLIQRTIRTSFSGHTVVTIAHRLHTVLSYSKILVLDHGRVAEYGAPWELTRRENSVLRSMIASHGPEMEQRLLKMAERARRRTSNGSI